MQWCSFQFDYNDYGKRKDIASNSKYGSFEFQEEAWPYKKNAHDEQVETCVDSIHKQIGDSGRTEMVDAFLLSEEVL